MAKLIAVVIGIASLLLAAPIIETGTSGSTNIFVAIGNAEGGGGGD
ncbi:MAG: hypothetical protein HY294_06660 [Candidatus Rokubacteria bacterium]|nr:hypothetical protein [Candidatus Rokubacteria bacterium]MBI3825656.1 hypothetical protein [Candidatus Rokubacteria bacterium]